MRLSITRTLLSSATAALVLAGGTVNAAAQHAEHEMQIDRSTLLEHHPELDRDGDGKLNDEEIHQAHLMMQHAAADALKEIDLQIFDRGEVLKRFPEADRDSNESLDDDELRRAIIHIHMSRAADSRARHFKRLAGIDRAEVLKSHPELDADGDGDVSDDELHAAFVRMHGRGTAPDKMHSADDLRLIDRAAVLDLYPNADSDGDGVLSDKEVQLQLAKLIGRHDSHGAARGGMNLRNIDRAEVLKRHPEVDTDGDGTISDEELHEAFRRMHGDQDAQLGGGHGKTSKK